MTYKVRLEDRPAPLTDRTSALVAAIAILVMAVLAPLSLLGPIKAVVNGTAPPEGTAFWLAVTGAALIAVLDVVAGWALWRLFRPADPRLAALTGGARVVYGIVFLIAIASLAQATPAGADTFQRTWDGALGIFGAHLVLLGILSWRSRVVPRWISALTSLAGASYLVDAIGNVASSAYTADIASYLFVGEPVFMVWLGWWALRRRGSRRSERYGRPSS
ncbi:DUF4386 domain-containing protein [Plantibacter flavus]|uniref:DUF4386 domain-containing protein n=1 Tax=Plantibacter flavus TaxID=150123 RepID=UPI003F18C739